MSRKRVKKKKGSATASNEAVSNVQVKTGKQKTHTPRPKEKAGAPPWLIPVLVFLGLLAFVALALVAQSHTSDKRSKAPAVRNLP